MAEILRRLLTPLLAQGSRAARERKPSSSWQTPMSLRLKPETRAFLEAQAEVLGCSVHAVAQAILNGTAQASLEEGEGRPTPAIDDRLFRGSYCAKRRRWVVAFPALAGVARRLSAEAFGHQLEALVAQCPDRELLVDHNTSAPVGLGDIVQKLPCLDFVELTGRDDVLPPSKTLEVALVIPAGRVLLRPYWSAYKSERASELLSELRWLWIPAVRDKVFLHTADNPLTPLASDVTAFIRQVFRLLDDNHYGPDELVEIMKMASWFDLHGQTS